LPRSPVTLASEAEKALTHRQFLIAYATVLPAALAAARFGIGGPAVLIVLVAAILVLAARFDNHTGSCLMVTIILLVVIGMLLSLLMVVGMTGTR
jgi:hypothetical protein